MNRAEQKAQDAQTQLERAHNKIESLGKELSDMKHKFSNLEKKMKETTTKHVTERDELIKAMTKIEHKEAQYRHEIKNKEL